MSLQSKLGNPYLTRYELFALYKAMLAEKYALLRIEFCPPDKLEIVTGDGETHTVYLENLWRTCQWQSLDERVETVERHLRSLSSTIENSPNDVKKENIVPTIKDDEYLTLFGNAASVVREHIAGDIWIVYALDLPDSVRALNESQLSELQVMADELRALAVKNLRRILPEIQRHGAEPVYILTAGGDYDASILLFDDVWTQMESVVEGDIVAAVPSRDILFVTGSRSKEGIEHVRRKVIEIHEGGDHVISQTLLRRVAGKWKAFV